MNTMAEQDWDAFRTLVKELLRDPTTRKRIEQRTDIAPRTLSRWVSGETEEPDRKRLSILLAALPEHRDALLATITQAMPDFEAPLLDPATRLVEDLPMDFWVRLLETNANTPRNLHFASIVHLIFLQLQSALDPEHIGVQLIIAQCSPPASPGQPVRSLREVMKMTTHQSLLTSPGDTIFLGAESLSGYSVSLCQASIVQNVYEEQRLPVRRARNEQSAAAYPIQRGGYVAGCFLVSSPQPDLFSQRLQYLLQIYAYLLSTAFETEAFYAPEQIRLRLMPAEQIQHQYIANFQQRVMTILQGDLSLSRLQAEIAAWQQIEEELLAFPPSTD
jgi:transcriptional regulator with XRE-family HTH domain